MEEQDSKKILRKLASIEDSIKFLDVRVNVLEGNEKPVLAEAQKKAEVIKPVQKRITESEIGTKWLAWGGMAAVVIAAGFLILYAIQNNWISPIFQIILGVAIGILLIFLGTQIEKRGLDFYSKVFFAGGFPIIFYSLFASHQFYEMFSFEITASLISLLVIGAVYLAYIKNSKTIAAEAFLLGYLLPLITLKIDPFLLAYSLILFAGITLLLSKKQWSLLYYGGIAINFAIYYLWIANYTIGAARNTLPNELALTYNIAYLFLFFALIALSTIYYNLKENRLLQSTVVYLLACFWIYYSLGILMNDNFAEYVWLFRALFIAVLFVATMATNKEKILYSINRGLIFSFLAVAIASIFNVPYFLTVLLFYAIIMWRISIKNKNTELTVIGIVCSVIGFIIAVVSLATLKEINLVQILNSTRLFSFLLAAPVFYYLFLILKDKIPALEGNSTKTISDLYFGAASILVLVFLTIETLAMGIVTATSSVLISVIWIMLAVFYLLFGFRKNLKISRLTGIAIFAITVLKIFIIDLAGLETFYRIGSFFVLGIILLFSALLYKKYDALLSKSD